MSQKAKNMELDLGVRKISRMNFSYIVTIPKIFVQNTMNGNVTRKVRIIMLKDGSLKIAPIFEKTESVEFSIM